MLVPLLAQPCIPLIGSLRKVALRFDQSTDEGMFNNKTSEARILRKVFKNPNAKIELVAGPYCRDLESALG